MPKTAHEESNRGDYLLEEHGIPPAYNSALRYGNNSILDEDSLVNVLVEPSQRVFLTNPSKVNYSCDGGTD